MTDRQINRGLRRLFSMGCWLLVGYYILVNILAYAELLLEALRQILWNLATGQFLLDIDPMLLTQNAWGYMTAICTALVVLWAWLGRENWHGVFTKEASMTVSTFCRVVCLCVGCQMLNTFWVALLEWILNGFGISVLPMLEYVGGGSTTVSMFLYAAIAAPIWEELLFRGILLRLLRPYGRRFAILGSAVLFGLFHGNLLQTPYAFVMGLLLGYLTCQYSIGWAMALHLINNLFLAEGMTWLTQRLPYPMGEGIQLLLLGGCLLASIGILTLHREGIREYRQGEWIDRRCLLCFFTNSGFLVLVAIMMVNMVLFFFA